jgi:hypothetical protein
MNWKKFLAEYHLLKSGLEDYQNTNIILFKIITLILRGETQPELILSWATSPIELTQLVSDDLAAELSAAQSLDAESLYLIIGHWIQLMPQEATLLGEVYEKLAIGHRVRGLYYTPPAVIDFILLHTVEHCDIVVNPKVKVLDPACGCGYFLLKAYDILLLKFRQSRAIMIEKYPNEDWSDEGIHRHIIQYNLWGADIDQVAGDIATVSLLLKRQDSNHGLQPNIIVCDSLKRSEDTAATGKERAFWTARYHYVVGNPPYLSFGLRGTRSMDIQYKEYLRQTYGAAEYKLSYYVLFMQRGIEMLVKGGKLSFIIPDSFLLGRYYSKIRRYIMENTAIELIAQITSPVFKNASTGYSIICVFTKRSDSRCRMQQLVNIYQAEDAGALKKAEPLCYYEQNYFAGLPHQRFRIFFELSTKELVDRIDKMSTPLHNFASGHTGIRSVSRQNDIVSTVCQGEKWRRGLVSGSQLCRYYLEYKNHWLHIDPQLLYKGGWKSEIIKQRKILIRQTGYMLTACIDNEGFYHLNNIHSFVLKNTNVTLDYLLLILNSRFMSFYYHVVSMEYGRSMAQTDIETLELLPIIIHPKINQQAPELVKMMNDCAVRGLVGDVATKNKAEAFDEYLNQLVYRIYGLNDAEIAYVEQYETKLTNCQKPHKAGCLKKQ